MAGSLATNRVYRLAPIIVDLETAPHPSASSYLEAPDLDAITPSRNLRDPIKITEDLERRKAEALSHYANLMLRAALDWNLSRIVAIGWSTDGGETVDTETCRDDLSELTALSHFWEASRGRQLLGFSIRTFDAPTLVQRSRLLGIEPRDLSLARYGRGSVIDLRDILTFDDARYEAIMPRTLKAFCRRFDIPVRDEVNGSEIPALVAAGEWDKVVAHLISDVRLTAALAKRIGVLEEAVMEAAEAF